MDVENYRFVDGLWAHRVLHEDILRSAFSYQAHHDDVFVATYPKCGTTWTQYLILSILSKGEPPKRNIDFMLASPFLELMGAEAAERMSRPGVLKTHLPFNKAPYCKDAKYICVARNPYDVCVSYYYHTKGFTPKSVKDVSFATFHDLFILGKLSYGDYFEHLLSWYEQRNLTNVLFVTYEQAKKDSELWALKIADFLGKGYGDELRKEPALLQKVLEVCSLENMRRVFNDNIPNLFEDLLSLPPEKALKSVEVYRNLDLLEEMHESEAFVRKGTVGDWRAHFTPELIAKTKTWINKKTKGSDVMQLWSDIELP
ncbi:sulfotransferase ssu-1-like [Dermacentor variabilis]|uniref:sulfotransferase ssu-1-like n=1 Tax=Dermacentor variabilis TaxID=34621 RepID=UPI003F5BB313